MTGIRAQNGATSHAEQLHVRKWILAQAQFILIILLTALHLQALAAIHVPTEEGALHAILAHAQLFQRHAQLF